MTEPTTNSEDFEPKSAIRKLSASLEQPDKFAEIFCAAAKTQKNIDQVLKDVVKNLLQYDTDARITVKGLLREVDKEDLSSFWRKGGKILVPVLTLILGALLQGLSRKYFP